MNNKVYAYNICSSSQYFNKKCSKHNIKHPSGLFVIDDYRIRGLIFDRNELIHDFNNSMIENSFCFKIKRPSFSDNFNIAHIRCIYSNYKQCIYLINCQNGKIWQLTFNDFKWKYYSYSLLLAADYTNLCKYQMETCLIENDEKLCIFIIKLNIHKKKTIKIVMFDINNKQFECIIIARH